MSAKNLDPFHGLQDDELRDDLQLPIDCVIHSLRHIFVCYMYREAVKKAENDAESLQSKVDRS